MAHQQADPGLRARGLTPSTTLQGLLFRIQIEGH